MTRILRGGFFALVVAFGVFAGLRAVWAAPARNYETTAVTVRIGSHTRTFSLAALQQMPKVTLPNVQLIGTDKGPQGEHTWSGASLREVVLGVDPGFCGSANRGRRLRVTSQDGWAAYIKWVELCGVPTGGEALFNIKSCNECHGIDGEGAPKDAVRAGPMLKGRSLDPAAVLARLRSGRAQHGYIIPYAPDQLAEADLQQILDWLAGKDAAVGAYTVPENRRMTLLAFEEDGQPMTGRDGLIQMVVGMDDYVNRFAHWVSDIDAE